MYEYLQKFRITKEEIGNVPTNENVFLPVTQDEIGPAEIALGMAFPGALRSFYSEVGYGFLLQGINGDMAQELNRILHPDQVCDCVNQGDSGLEVGDLPVFEATYGSFFVMRPRSDTPDALFIPGFETPLEISFTNFVRRLYFESPNFYWDLIRKRLL